MPLNKLKQTSVKTWEILVICGWVGLGYVRLGWGELGVEGINRTKDRNNK